MVDIRLSPLVQRYISTCYLLPDHAHAVEVEHWKERLRSSCNECITVNLEEIATVFTHVGRLLREGNVSGEQLDSYFEGLGNGSHNLRMYQLFTKLQRRRSRMDEKILPQYDAVLEGVLEHIEGCSVRPAFLRSSLVFGYRGPCTEPIDEEHFKNTNYDNRVFVHGRSGKGAVVVRSANEQEFEAFVSWWTARAASVAKRFPYLLSSLRSEEDAAVESRSRATTPSITRLRKELNKYPFPSYASAERDKGSEK